MSPTPPTAPGDYPSRRILVTGLSTYWGGRLAQALEGLEEVEAIVGVDTQDPTRELERTEFVRVGNQHSLIQRIVQAAEIDTVIDTRLVVDSVTTSPRLAHENNVIGTMNILAACTGADSPVRKFILKSSAHYYGCEQDDPAFFTEQMRRPHPPRTAIERDICEAEASVREFAEKHPATTVTVLRFANVMGPTIGTSFIRLFSLPVVPMIFGFDPRLQFVHEDDVVHALEHAALHQLPGVFNVAADGVLAMSEVAGLLGKQPAPFLPPWGTGLFAGPLRRLGFRIPDEMLNQLRFGRALDNRKLRATGFDYQYTTREAALKLRENMRLASIMRGSREPYRYEREVEEFLRWSPYVRQGGTEQEGAPGRLSRRQLADFERALGQEPTTGRGRMLREESVRAAAEGQVLAGETEGDPESAESREAGREAPEAAVVEVNAPEPTGPPLEGFESLESEEVIALLGTLDREALESLRRHESDGRRRESVLAAIDGVLGRAGVNGN